MSMIYGDISIGRIRRNFVSLRLQEHDFRLLGSLKSYILETLN